MQMDKQRNRLLTFLVAIFIGTACAVSAPGFGAKVYKWIDEDGKVTYRDKPPPADSGGNTEIKDIDSNSNVIQYDTPPAEPQAPANGTQPSTPAAGGGETAPPETNANENLGKGATALEEQRRLEKLRKEQEQQRLEEEQRRIEQMPRRTIGF